MSPRVVFAPVLALVMLLCLWAAAVGQSPTLSQGPIPGSTPAAVPTAPPIQVFPTAIGPADNGVLVGVRNPVTLPSGATASAVIGVQAPVSISGHAKVVVIVDGPVMLTGSNASVDTLVLVRADATLGPGTTVGTIRTLSSTIHQDPTAMVSNGIHDLKDSGIVLFGLIGGFLVLLFIGWAIALLVSGVVVAATAAKQMRRMARSISNEPLKVLGAGLVGLFVPLILGGLLFVTVVGIPLALLLWLLGAFAVFVGYIALGVWLGDLLLRRGRRPDEGKPIASVLLGLVLLIVVGFVPLVSLFAAWFALGTATLNGWRSFRARGGGSAAPAGGDGAPGGGDPAWGAPGQPTWTGDPRAPGTQTGWTPPPASGTPAGWGQPQAGQPGWGQPQAGQSQPGQPGWGQPQAGWGQRPVPPPAGQQPGWGQAPVPPPAGPPPGWGQSPQR